LGAVSGSTLLTVTAPATGSVTYTYDSQGRLASATYTSPTGSVTVTYSYDAAGNRTAVVAK
jgi:YD repeat-containing protein